jgi:hypothetical protein
LVKNLAPVPLLTSTRRLLRDSPSSSRPPSSGAFKSFAGPGKRRGRNPSLTSIYRALAEHDKAQTYPDAIHQAHAEFAALQTAEQATYQ